MDSLGAGIFGVVGLLLIADLTKGTGSFNAAQGAHFCATRWQATWLKAKVIILLS
jgi:hypothetical protein